jgi:predicted RNA-binding protein YlxR (DUF448 family)
VRPKAELLRVVRNLEGEVLVDPTGKAAGRGAYVCRRRQCAEQAVTQKRLTRALGVAVGSDVLECVVRELG